MSIETVRPRLAVLAPTIQHQRLCPPLEAAGFEVAACESRPELLDEVLSIAPAVVVVRDEGEDGPSEQFYRSLARRRQRVHLVVVVSLPYPDALHRSICLQRGVDGVIDDRMATEEVRSILHSCLRRRSEVLALQAERDQLASSLDLLDEGVLIIDEAGQVQHANSASLDLLDVDADVLRQQSVPRLLNVLGVARETIDRVLRSEETLSELIQLHVAGEEREIEVSCVRVDDSPGGARRWMVSLRDRSNEEERHRLQADFHSMIAHDLRSSLTLLEERARILQELEASDGGRRIASEIQEQAEELSDLLEVRALHPGASGPEDYGEIPIRGWIEQGTAEVATLFRARGRELSVEIDPALEGSGFQASPERTKQVLRDVLVYVSRVAPAGSSVRLEARPDGPFLVLAVGGLRLDDGVGSSPSETMLQAARHVLETHGGGLEFVCPDGKEPTLRLRVLLRAERDPLPTG